MRGSTFRNVVWLALLAVLIGACTNGGEQVSKAGGSAPPLVLRIGTDDHQGKPASDQIEEFARQVEELSEGSIVIEPVWHSAGDGPDWDQRVARMVVSGELDMGNIPARAWDTEGVTSLRALNAPFLITSDELVAEVITSDLVDEMMSGLEDIGVVGLTLFPEGLRHPFGFAEPLLGPEDYKGQAIRTPTSATTEAMFAALGAAVTDDEPNASDQAGMESAYVLGPSGSATGNVVFYPKVNSLVVNAEAFAGLTGQQQEILHEAATATQAWAIEMTPSDAAAAAEFCELEQAVVLASSADLAALEAATAPVYAELEADELTKSLISRIREMKTVVQVSTSVAAACGKVPDVVTAGGTTSTVIDGIYRFEVSEDQLRAGGVNEADIRDVTGTYTWTFANGEVGFVQTGPYPESAAADDAIFTVEGDLLTIVWDDLFTEVFRWTTNDSGDLILTVVSDPPDWLAVTEVYVAQPWVRVGDGETVENVIDGVYRLEVTDEELVEAGLTDPVRIADNHGVITWTLKNPEWCFSQRAPGIAYDECGTFELDDHEIVMSYPQSSYPNEVYSWTRASNGDLSFEVIHVAPSEMWWADSWFGESWIRIGDADS